LSRPIIYILKQITVNVQKRFGVTNNYRLQLKFFRPLNNGGAFKKQQIVRIGNIRQIPQNTGFRIGVGVVRVNIFVGVKHRLFLLSD